MKNIFAVRIITIIFFISVFLISCNYFKVTFSAAKEKKFWIDEQFSLEVSVKNFTIRELLVNGARGEGSAAPLDYIMLKIYELLQEPLHSLGLPPNIYYRLNSILFSYLSGIIVIFIIFFGIRRSTGNYLIFFIQSVFLIAALLTYFFWYYNLKFAIETRPYSLWNSLWFTALMLFMYYKKFNPGILISLILLAATATASIFQLCCFAASYLIIKLLNKDKLKSIVLNIVKFFGLPIAVSLYYIFIRKETYYFADFPLHTKQFFTFWLAKEMIPILSVLGILLTLGFKELRSHLTVFIVMLLLYIVSPLINYLVLSNGFFFSSRQYLYYDLIYPVFFTSIALGIPHFFNKTREMAITEKR